MPVAAQRWVDELALPERAGVLAWLWEAQSEGVALLANYYRMPDANEAATPMLGTTREALLGTRGDHPIWSVVLHEDGTRPAPMELPGGTDGPTEADGPEPVK